MSLSPFTVDHASERVSDRYTFIPTTKVVDAMADAGWVLSSTAETKAKEKNKGFQKHMARFRPVDPKNEIRVGDSIAEILMQNSHNGTTAYRFSGGVWRIVCGNGLIVSEVAFPGVVARHQGDLESILKASLEVAARLPELAAKVNAMKRVGLTEDQRVQFAREAMKIRYDRDDILMPSDLLHVRRKEDEPNDLWTVFNRVQENLSRGGQVGQLASGDFRRMRPMGGLDKTIDVNTRLWDLATAFAG